MWASVTQLVVFLLAGSVASAQVIADFESGASPPATDLTATIVQDDPAQGAKCLRVSASTTQPSRAYLRLKLPGDLDLAHHDRIEAHFRAKTEVKLRWLAVDEKGRPIFQRRFTLPPGEKWVQLDEPLRMWRWDDRFVGDWDEVRQLALRIDSPGASFDLDDVRLAGQAKPEDRAESLLKLAFADRKIRTVGDADLLVATDAVQAFADADLKRLFEEIGRARVWLRRVFGDSARPTDQGGPVCVLIFADDAGYLNFFARLGNEWRVEVKPPASQGYTVQDIAASTYKQELGVRRPVYLHEAVHALVARDLRLLTGHAPHTPLQEGIANYVQLCVYPTSVRRRVYVENFARPIDPAGASFFKPLKQLFSTRATTAEYAQLASVVAYLVEKDPQILRVLARGLAEGSDPAQLTDWDALERAWLTWGKARFRGDSGGPHFDLPPEFR